MSERKDYSLGPARPINIEKRCRRHKWNPFSWIINKKNKNLECLECFMAKTLGVELKPFEDIEE